MGKRDYKSGAIIYFCMSGVFIFFAVMVPSFFSPPGVRALIGICLFWSGLTGLAGVYHLTKAMKEKAKEEQKPEDK